MYDLDSTRVDELAALLAIADEGSFIAAGRALRRHSSVVSKRIAALEARLGVRLLERTTRRVRLTEPGLRLVDRIRHAADAIEEAEREASAAALELRGKLKLSFPAAMGRAWLAPALPAFMRSYPLLDVEVDYSERYVDLVAEGFDAAIRMGNLADSRLTAKKLGEHRLVLAAAPEYLGRHEHPASPFDLVRHNVLEYSGPVPSFEWGMSRGERRETITPRGSFKTNDIAALLEAARGGVGIVCAGEWLMARDIAVGALIPVLPDWKFDMDGGVYLVRPSSQLTPARTEAFVNWITDFFGNDAPWADIDSLRPESSHRS